MAATRLGFGVVGITTEIDEDHVGMDPRDRDAFDPVEYLADRDRHRMVVHESIAVVVERVDSRGRQNTSLTHSATEHLAPTAGARDQLGGSHEHTPDRRTQALGQADRDRIERCSELGFIDAQSRRSVP